MSETVKLPITGPVKKQYVFIGLAVSAGIVGYAWWKRGTSGAPPAEEGDITAADQLAYAPGVDSYSGAIPGGSTVSGSVPGEGPPLTNAEWSQRIVDLLEGVGFDRNFAATTIGKYLSGNQLTLAEAALVQSAIALLGNPPAGALPIIRGGTTTTPTPTPTPKPTPKPKPTAIKWGGHKVTAAESHLTLRQFAAKFSGSSHPDAVESTLRKIASKNPTVWARTKLNKNKLRAGWIVLVPSR